MLRTEPEDPGERDEPGERDGPAEIRITTFWQAETSRAARGGFYHAAKSPRERAQSGRRVCLRRYP
jgi:hypothetical protein